MGQMAALCMAGSIFFKKVSARACACLHYPPEVLG